MAKVCGRGVLGSTLGCVVAELTMPLGGWANLSKFQSSRGLIFGLRFLALDNGLAR